MSHKLRNFFQTEMPYFIVFLSMQVTEIFSNHMFIEAWVLIVNKVF